MQTLWQNTCEILSENTVYGSPFQIWRNTCSEQKKWRNNRNYYVGKQAEVSESWGWGLIESSLRVIRVDGATFLF